MIINRSYPKYLTESCLLTFGLKSVTSESLFKNWTDADISDAQICRIEKGEIKISGIEEYLAFRETKPRRKFSCCSLDDALEQKLSGALTASGTMEVCRRLGIPYAVSCGIGGIGDIKGEELCPDLPALRDSGVVLVCTSPKDMLDIEATIKWLTDNGVKVLGSDTNICTGYIFTGKAGKLDGILKSESKAPLLILNPIQQEKRIGERSVLLQAISDAKDAEARGEYYHPAANASIDRQTQGYSSEIQLMSLIDNVALTAKLTANC